MMKMMVMTSYSTTVHLAWSLCYQTSMTRVSDVNVTDDDKSGAPADHDDSKIGGNEDPDDSDSDPHKALSKLMNSQKAYQMKKKPVRDGLWHQGQESLLSKKTIEKYIQSGAQRAEHHQFEEDATRDFHKRM
jgi:hypothetical protein